MSTPELLVNFETCNRKGFFARDWTERRLPSVELLRRAIATGVTTTEADFGQEAGDRAMELAVEPGMQMPTSRNLHGSVVHHAALADILVTALRRPQDVPWCCPPPTEVNGAPWASGAFVEASGARLRRVVLVSNWNDERHYSEIRNWHTLGEVAAYRLPMTLAVVILGQHRDGRRQSPWTKGFLHPNNHKLRFRKKTKVTSETFSDRWEQVWREDRGEITTKAWLQAMLDDDILRDVCFKVEIDVPLPKEVERIRDMAARKLDRLAGMKQPPEPNLSTCDRPRCPFWGCWEQVPNEKTGFVRIE